MSDAIAAPLDALPPCGPNGEDYCFVINVRGADVLLSMKDDQGWTTWRLDPGTAVEIGETLVKVGRAQQGRGDGQSIASLEVRG